MYLQFETPNSIKVGCGNEKKKYIILNSRTFNCNIFRAAGTDDFGLN